MSILATLRLQGYCLQPPQILGCAIFAALTFHLNWLEAQRGYLPANWTSCGHSPWRKCLPVLSAGLLHPAQQGLTDRPAAGFHRYGALARLAYAHSGIWSDTSYLGGMDAIALGYLAALLAPKLALQRPRLWALQLTGAAMMTLVLGFSRWTWLPGLGKTEQRATVLGLGACLIMMAVVQTRPSGSWVSAPLRWFGRNSYEVYLTHMFIVLFGTRMFLERWTRWWWAPIWLLGMVCLAGGHGALLARAYSEPMNQWLRRGMRRSRVSVVYDV